MARGVDGLPRARAVYAIHGTTSCDSPDRPHGVGAGLGAHGPGASGDRMDLTADRSQKITPRHLRRQAYLYVRQSTLRQVVENTESTERQYALRQRAVALGWPLEQVVVIDSDQGHSGASTADREGFQRLVRDVGLGRAGLVMGLEVARLARNSTDWHR